MSIEIELLDDPSSLSKLAISHRDNEEYEKAIQYFKMACEKNHVESMINLAMIYDRIYSNYDLAKKYYLMASKFNNIDALVCLGCLYYNKYNDDENALKYFLLAKDSNDTCAIKNIAHIYYDREDYTNALIYYKTLMQLNVRDERSLHNMSLIYFHVLKKYDDALTCLKLCSRIDSANADYMRHIANIYCIGKNDNVNALKYLKKSLELNSSDIRTLKYIGYIHQCDKNYVAMTKYYKCAITHGCYESAIEMAYHYINIVNDRVTASNYFIEATSIAPKQEKYRVMKIWKDMIYNSTSK